MNGRKKEDERGGSPDIDLPLKANLPVGLAAEWGGFASVVNLTSCIIQEIDCVSSDYCCVPSTGPCRGKCAAFFCPRERMETE